MVATEFLDYVNKFRGLGQVGIEDFADKFNSLYSVAILVICITVITIKQYFMAPLACYSNAPHPGLNLDSYVDNYCWVEGTINVRASEVENTPNGWKQFKDKTLLYYQWVPFVLALQCILFIIPRFFWQMLTYNRTGTDLEELVKMGSEASTADSETREKKVQHIASTLKNVIIAAKKVRLGRVSDTHSKPRRRVSPRVISKRMGTWVTGYYFFIKIAYLCNSIGQIFLIERFLGISSKYKYFGLELAIDIANGKDWRQNDIFPRVTFCRIPLLHLGAINYQTSQCVLGINFLNEKIYIFLWFWLIIVSLLTFASIIVWLICVINTRRRSRFIKRNLLLTNRYERKDKSLILSFMSDYLRHDGLFILRMLSINAGNLITSEIVASLWDAYKKDMEPQKDNEASNDQRRDVAVEMQSLEVHPSHTSLPQSKSKEALYMEEVVV